MNIASTSEYLSRRSPLIVPKAAVASSQPAASLAGVDILRAGGSAADAAVAVAAALQVTQPCSTGLGGDCFFLYYDEGEGAVWAYNGSGRSPRGLDPATLEREGISDLPPFHAHTVTVPGAPEAWEAILTRFGRLSRESVLAPAIELAEAGFCVEPLTARWWAGGAERQLAGRAHGEELLVDGRAPRAGELFRNPSLAWALRRFAEEGSLPFYRGEIAARIVEAVHAEGGALTPQDLANHRGEWVEPISLAYGTKRIYECPPNGQGLAALIALNVARNLDLGIDESVGSLTAERYHLLAEAMRIGFADAWAWVADPHFAEIPIAELLSASYGQSRASEIHSTRANRSPAPFAPTAGTDTVYFSVVDARGNAASFINSNYMGFGTGIVPRGCGYSLQNRGKGFSLDPNSPNVLEPRKRPYHTIIPGMITDDASGAFWASFGVMGGMMQPQGHLQVVTALIDDELDSQAALDRPRFQIADGRPDAELLVELPSDDPRYKQLAAWGQSPRSIGGLARYQFGLGQIILRREAALWAGSDPRGDGLALGY
jgi:gamma-glutamyltranspeptidase/glutathione hydrolase